MIIKELENINYTNYEIGCLLETARNYICDITSKTDTRKIDIISVLVDTCIEKNTKTMQRVNDLLKEIYGSGKENVANTQGLR